MSDLNEVAAFVREMKKMKAQRVRVGDVEVDFGVELVPIAPLSQRERMAEAEADAKREEKLRFAHVEGL